MIKRGLLPVVLSVLALLGNGCGDPGVPSEAIQVLDNLFSPRTFTTTVGTNVSWVWNGSNPHDVNFSDGGSSSEVQTSGQFDRVFPAAGTYNYGCTIHPGMQGTVEVK